MAAPKDRWMKDPTRLLKAQGMVVGNSLHLFVKAEMAM